MRADRLLSIMLLLQTEGKMTAQVLATRLEVSRRTILRDINALSTAGVPVYAEGGPGGGITLDDLYQTTLAGMKEREVRTLFVGGNTQMLSEIGFGDAAESAMLKLRAILPETHQTSVDQIRQRILIDPYWWWRDSQPLPWWSQLQQAVFEDRCIQVIYERHDGELVERVLEAYSLVAKSSIWYLIANHGGEFRSYRVLRFREITLLDRHFHRREDFDLPTFWQEQLKHFGELVSEYSFTLKMNPEKINFLNTIVPGRYNLIGPPQLDGWLTVQFHLDSMDLAKMLVFGLGKHAIILEPQALQEAVLNNARTILDGHNNDNSFFEPNTN